MAYYGTATVMVYESDGDDVEPTSSEDDNHDDDHYSSDDDNYSTRAEHGNEKEEGESSNEDGQDEVDYEEEYNSDEYELARLVHERMENEMLEQHMEEYELEKHLLEAMLGDDDEEDLDQEVLDDDSEYDSQELEAIWLGVEENEGVEWEPEEEIEEISQQQWFQDQLWEHDDQYPDDIISSIPTPLFQLSHISPLLYRVFDDDSVSKYTSTGFTAGSTYMPSDPIEFGNMVENHADWRNRVKTPFISTTDNQRVVDWQISIRDRPNILVAIIDTAMLVDVLDAHVWEMNEAMDHFRIEPPRNFSRRTFNYEYICGLRIPLHAVVEVCEPHLFRESAKEYLLGR